MKPTLVFLAAVLCLWALRAQPPASQAAKPAAKGFVEGRLTWVDRQGRSSSIGEPGLYRTLSVSPNGRRIAVERTDPESQNRDIWLMDAGGRKPERFTSHAGWEAFPTWSRNGSRIIFTSNRSGQFDLYQKKASGESEESLLFASAEGKGPTSWAPDGRTLLYYTLGAPTHATLFSLVDQRSQPLVDAKFSSITARFSSDGKWIVYTSNESGQNEVWARPWDSRSGVGAAVRVTQGGGRTPLWRADGREIYYLSPDGSAMAVEVDGRTKVPKAPPRSLFKVPNAVLFWDASPDGARFLFPVPG